MLFVTMNRKEFVLIIVFVVLFAMSIVGISTFGFDQQAVPVVALEEYLVHEGIYYQRTLSVVSVIDKKLYPSLTHYEGRPLYKETNEKFPDRLLWPLDQELYTVFVKIES